MNSSGRGIFSAVFPDKQTTQSSRSAFMTTRLWLSAVSVLGILISSPALAAIPNSVLLNEANTVSSSSFLEDDKTDPVHGRVQGNAQNWIELIVVQGDDLGGGSFKNTIDMRGWKLEWSYSAAADKQGAGVVTFSNDPLWSAVPRGTAITISEWQQTWYLTNTPPAFDPAGAGGLEHKGGINGLGNLRNDPYDSQIHTLIDLSTKTSWNPAVNDWHINVFAGERNPDTSFRFFSFTGSVTEPDGMDEGTDPDVFTIGVDNEAGIFPVNNDAWQLTIRDAANNVIQGPIGEAVPGWGGSGISSQEILKIETFANGTNPTIASYLSTTGANYNDGSSSTFGLANVWSSGSFAQDLGPLRSWWTAPQQGDFDGDGDVDGADFVVWQTNFPKSNGALLAQGDADGDGDVDGADFVVWQTNFPFSPGPGASPVPEPAGLLLAGVSIPAIILTIRRRGRIQFC
jgi:hypothetical protein